MQQGQVFERKPVVVGKQMLEQDRLAPSGTGRPESRISSSAPTRAAAAPSYACGHEEVGCVDHRSCRRADSERGETALGFDGASSSRSDCSMGHPA